MKKWALLALLLFSSANVLRGFDLSVALKAGLGYPFFSGTDYQAWLGALEDVFLADNGYPVDFETSWISKSSGYSVGLSMTLGLFDLLALQPEVFYTWAGGAYGYSDPGGFGNVVYMDRLNYAEAVVLTVFRLGSGRRTLNLFAGPDLAVRLQNVRMRIYQEGNLVAQGSWADTQFARWFWNLVVGAGVTSFYRDGRLFTFEARCTVGMSSVMNTQLTGLEFWKQNQLQLMLGFGRVLAGEKAVQRGMRSRIR